MVTYFNIQRERNVDHRGAYNLVNSKPSRENNKMTNYKNI